MTDLEEVIEAADKLLVSEIKKYKTGPPRFLFDAANQKGKELAEKYKVDVDIVQVGTRLMDLKLGEAMANKKPKEHIEMSVEAAKEFLSQYDLDKEVVDKIVNCVEGHHGTTKWICKEAEICANADCYKFLQVRTWMAFFNYLGKRDTTFDEDLRYAEEKADEKWNVLSLEIPKKELEPQYKMIKEMVKKAESW